MKLSLRLSFLIICIVFCCKNSFAQKYTIHDFYKIDSLANQAKPKDALALIEIFNTQARADQNAAMLIKSVIYRMTFQSYLEENMFDKILADLKKDINLAKQPAKSILQSLLAEMYWKYYQQNRWRIAQRTNIEGDTGEDINTWSIPKLSQEITKTYLSSLQEKELLQQTKVDVLDHVLSGDKRNRIFRPTLYDLLAHRAIDVFTNTQITLTQADTETIDFNDPVWFADRVAFVKTDLPESDSTFFYTAALQTFKNLIVFHTLNDNKAALADADLKRLKFIARQNNDKDLYFEALDRLALNSRETEVYADILYEQASLHKNASLQTDTNKLHLINAVVLANKAIQAYPKSVGAENAERLSNQIKASSLTTKIKQYLLPNKPAQLYFSYTNVDTIYVKLYPRKLQDQPFEKIDNKEKFLKFVTGNKALKDWIVIVPKSDDYRNHSLIDKIDGLPVGNYFIIAQNTKANAAKTVYSVSHFSVTSLNAHTRYLMNDTVRHFFITDNARGTPVEGAKITPYKSRYNASPLTGPTAFTDLFGLAAAVGSNFDRAVISYGKDSLLLSFNNYMYAYKNDDEKKVILFTDRPIYRPGQTIYYKGLWIEKDLDRNKILTNEKIDVSFKDANQKAIETVGVTTNEYGTFSGSFTIPVGKLNGRMMITTAYGSIDVQVEEYKRPTYEIVFNKPTQRYKLNDSIKVEGKAAAFSGYSISNARISYTVFRSAMYDPRLNYTEFIAIYGTQSMMRTQVAIGKASTRADGTFELSFFARVPDPRLNYMFTIEATITDMNGETRTNSTSLRVGKKDMQLAIAAKPVLFLSEKTDSISFYINNLNGVAIQADVKAEWSLLQAPARLMNKSPFYAENYSLSKEAFMKTFPDDEYHHELELSNWPVKKIQYEQSFSAIQGRGKLSINAKSLIPGYYNIRLTAINAQNDTLSLNQYVIVYGPKPQKIESNMEMVVAEHTTINPGESAIFRVAGLTNQAKGYYEVYYKNTIVEKVWLDLSPKQTLVHIKPKDHFENEFAVQFTMVHNGTVYNYLEQVRMVDPEKQLDIKFLSFRDKLQPGEKESWKLQISNKNNEKQMAEMVATLYDASLDNLKRMDWGSAINPGYNYYPYTWQYRTNDIHQGNSPWYLNPSAYYPFITRMYESLDWFGYDYFGAYNYSYQNYISRIRPKKGLAPEAVKKLAELAKGKVVYGVIVDMQGYTIPGAAVKAGKLTTTTNNFGVYAIDAKAGEELTVAYLGYKTSKIKIGQNKRVDITLQPDGSSLNEVTIVGAGSALRKETTAASSTVFTMMEMPDKALPSTPIKGKLEGKVAGLQAAPAPVIPRTNFNETAFFYPHLKTDENGLISIEFTIPQSLTRYKMLGFAHSKDLKTASISHELVTQKQLAISANAPRFFREGDTLLLSAKLNNLSGKKLNGQASLEIRNALTGKIIQIIANGHPSTHNFEITNDGNEVIKWPLIIPGGLSAISYKVIAQAGKFSDGEEMTVPVLPNALLVTESMPIPVRSHSSRTFNMEKLIHSGTSESLRHETLTFEFTANPVWYAIQALPYLMEYPYECAEQTFSRFYANSFAAGIINSSPKIAAVFNQWQNTKNGEALLSNLEKNPELKSILLEETPWVRNAENETERKKRLAVLFDLNRMTYELKSNFEKLEKMQYNDGSFPWFPGMNGDRYITQHIVLGIGQLKKLKLIDEKAFPNLNSMLNKALIYLDQQLVNNYKRDSRSKSSVHYYMPLHYLFARSYTNQMNTNADFVKARDYYFKRLLTDWKTFDSYRLAQAALVLHRSGNKTEPAKIITLLKQTAQQSDEIGMYWAKNTNGWWWYQSPVETQALLIEAFHEVAADNKAVEEMKIWLLKNKQTNDWKTTKATAAACYALLMKGYDLLSETAAPDILIGNKTMAQLGFTDTPTEAGTGYQKIRIAGADVKPEMGKVVVKNNTKTTAWGALYWQYFEQLDKITPANTGVKIKKQLFIQNTTAKGNVLTPISTKNSLTPGDLVKVRIEIYSDRDMEYVHLKDMRSSGFEPVNVISRYKYQDGLGYYESTKDASTNFFISYLRKGTYIFEYELRVTHAGNFSNGITSLQCMYAPEFTTNSEGIRVTVRE